MSALTSNPFEAIALQEIPTADTFDEGGYLAANPDVADVVRQGKLKSGWAHFRKFGRVEGRRQSAPDRDLSGVRRRKLTSLRPLLKDSGAAATQDGKYDFLSEALRRENALDDDIPVSENAYDAETISLIEGGPDGLILDVGAGFRPVYYSNVVNFEVKDYATTDVLGVAHDLPFVDGCFDGIISIAVLEHVRDPFLCAREIARVLKPGGWLKCCVPFLQPLHGYPHHYFNMTHEGLRALFEPHLDIERQEVNPATHPIWAIAWQLRAWAEALPPGARKAFLRQRLSDLIAFPGAMLENDWVQELPVEKQFELAAATVLFARKAH
jgi:SAM-dependent methyltransferase